MDQDDLKFQHHDNALIIEADDKDVELDVIAVHGPGGQRRETWTFDDDPKNCWLSTAFGGRVMLYSYDTDVAFSQYSTRHSIIRQAIEFLESLQKSRERVESEQRPIVLVSHGIGGLLVKAVSSLFYRITPHGSFSGVKLLIDRKAIVIASRDLATYEWFTLAVRTLVFFDYPHRTSMPVYLHQQIYHQMLETAQPITDMAAVAEALTEIIIETNGMFVQSNILIQVHIVNVISRSNQHFSPSEPITNSGTTLGIAFECTMEVDKPHSTMTRLTDIAVEYLTSRNDQWKAVILSGHQGRMLRVLSASSSPIFPAPCADVPGDMPYVDEFVSNESKTFLHVQSSSAGDDNAAGCICEYLRKIGINAIFFQFYVSDIRFSTMERMLCTLISLICNQIMHYRGMSIEMLEYLAITQSYSIHNLLDCLENAMFTFFNMDRKSVYVLGGLNQCGNTADEFLCHIGRIMDTRELHPKFIVTTSKGMESSFLDRIPKPKYMYCSVEIPAYEKITPSSLALWGQIDSWQKSDQIRSKISAITNTYQQDDDMLQLLQEWLDWHHRPWSAVEGDLLKVKAQDPDTIFEKILSDIPPERQLWAAALCSWVLLSFRPLWAEELVLVSSMIRGNAARSETVHEILGFFKGLLRIQHGEIRFGHKRIRAWLGSGSPVGFHQNQSQAQRHAEILETCISYLNAGKTLSAVTDWPANHHFLYAVEFWPSHYKLIRGCDDVSAMAQSAVRRLLDDTIGLDRWLEVYRLMGNPSGNFEEESNHPLEIAAHFGFEELVDVYYEESAEHISLSLIESAKRGHVQLVSKFLGSHPQCFCLEEPRLPRLLQVAASSSDNEALIDKILTHMPSQADQSRASLTWMSNLLLQSVLANSEPFVSRLLDLGADHQVCFDTGLDLKGVVEAAVSRNALGILQTFIDRGLDITPSSSGIGRPGIFSTLMFWGHPETIKLLFRNGFTAKMTNTEGQGFLYFAVVAGCHQSVDILLSLAPLEDYCCNAGEGSHPLLAGACNGSLNCVESMIRHNVDLSVAGKDGNALSYAVQNRRLHIVDRLLTEPAIDINYSSKTAKAPIFYAIDGKSPQELVKMLLEHGVDTEIRWQSVYNDTPLLRAASREEPEFIDVVRLLLEHKANRDARASDDWTPLHMACVCGSPGIVQLLVDAGANLYATCGEGKLTALHAATRRPEVVSILLHAGMDPSKSFGAKSSPLELAAGGSVPLTAPLMLKQTLECEEVLPNALLAAVRQGTEKVVRQLLEMGVDVNYTTDNNISLLCIAVARGNEAIVRTLLEFRPDLGCRTSTNDTIGHYIRTYTTVEVARLITNAGVAMDAVNSSEQTPLIVAVLTRNWAVVRYLLSVKSVIQKVNFSNRWGTALHQLSYLDISNKVEIMRLLVDSGADVNFDCGDEIGTALSRCCEQQGKHFACEKEQVIRYLIEECNARVHWSPPTAGCPLHLASRTCDAPIIKLLIANGADPEAADSIGRKPLHLACYNSLSAVQALLGGRKSPGQHDFAARDHLGRIPLHYAVASGQPDLITHVLAETEKAGLGIDTRDDDDWTPLLWVARNETVGGWSEDERSTNAIEVIEILLENNADPNARGSVPRHMSVSKWSAAEIAEYHQASQVAGFLKASGVAEIRSQKEIPSGRRVGPHKVGVKRKQTVCNACYLKICGLYWKCQQCLDFDLCYKCYPRHEQVHSKHDWLKMGEEEETCTELGSGLDQVHKHGRNLDDEHDPIDYDMGVVSDDSCEDTDNSTSGTENESLITSWNSIFKGAVIHQNT